MKATKYNPTLEAEFGVGNIYKIDAPFDEAVISLKGKIISLRDLVYARIKKGFESSLFQYGSYAKQGVVSGKDKLPLVIENSPLLDIKLAREAVESNRKEEGKYFRLQDKKRYEEYLIQSDKEKKKAPEERKLLILPSRTKFTISKTENFDIARGLFKDQAEDYLSLLENGKGIRSITFYTINSNIVDESEAPIVTQVWLGSLGGESCLGSGGRNLGCSSAVRGVLKKTGEASPHKISKDLPYTQKEVAKYLRILHEINQGQIKICDLESEVNKVAKFLTRLKQ